MFCGKSWSVFREASRIDRAPSPVRTPRVFEIRRVVDVPGSGVEGGAHVCRANLTVLFEPFRDRHPIMFTSRDIK
jgi:hypothetical protein